MFGSNAGTAAEVRQIDDKTVEFPNVLVLTGARAVSYFNVVSTEGEVLARRMGFTKTAQDDSEKMFQILEAQGFLEGSNYVVHDRREDLGTFDVIDIDTDKIVMNLVPAQ